MSVVVMEEVENCFLVLTQFETRDWKLAKTIDNDKTKAVAGLLVFE